MSGLSVTPLPSLYIALYPILSSCPKFYKLDSDHTAQAVCSWEVALKPQPCRPGLSLNPWFRGRIFCLMKGTDCIGYFSPLWPHGIDGLGEGGFVLTEGFRGRAIMAEGMAKWGGSHEGTSGSWGKWNVVHSSFLHFLSTSSAPCGMGPTNLGRFFSLS